MATVAPTRPQVAVVSRLSYGPNGPFGRDVGQTGQNVGKSRPEGGEGRERTRLGRSFYDPQHAAVQPARRSLGLYPAVVETLGDAAEGFTLLVELQDPGDGLLFLGIFDQLATLPEVPAERCMVADPLFSTTLYLHSRSCSFPNHGPFQFGEDARHLRHGPAVRIGHVETFGDGDQLYSVAVEG